jgi:deoxycytidylate deaminase
MKYLNNKNDLQKLCLDVAAKSPCNKRKVGAVLAIALQDGRYLTLAEGYNYNVNGGSCECNENKTKDSVKHAEEVCLDKFIKFATTSSIAMTIPDVSTNISYNARDKNPKLTFSKHVKVYVTHQPCENCSRLLLLHDLPFEVVETFMKFDTGKARLSLVPASFSEAAARALTYGAKKYKVNNWRNTESLERYVDALYRHLDAWRHAKDVDDHESLIDKDSKLSHLDCAAANLAFLIDLHYLPLRKN